MLALLGGTRGLWTEAVAWMLTSDGYELVAAFDGIEELAADTVVVRTYRGDRIAYPQPRERDCSVPYDAIYFAGVPADELEVVGERRVPSGASAQPLVVDA